MATAVTNEMKELESIGIVAMECYFPKFYVSQKELDQFDHAHVSNYTPTKYTQGLGQDEMSFVTDKEDIASICLTVLNNLMIKNKHLFSFQDIGSITIATETIIDHSKSISSMMQQLFEEHNNYNIEGIDVKHACYAGTYALFSAFERCTSKYWDGKYCIIICADIAEYAKGPARCTGGAGAVAIIIGKNGCIELDIIRSSFKSNVYDFYKPNLQSSYPLVDGHLSQKCFLESLDYCYNHYYQQQQNNNNNNISFQPDETFDYWIFHSPYNKLVQKSFARVIYNDFKLNPYKYICDKSLEEFKPYLEDIKDKPMIDVNNKENQKKFIAISKRWYDKQVRPSTIAPKKIGNCYTASIFFGLLSTLYYAYHDITKEDKKIGIFSYGSGAIASLYSLTIHSHKKELLANIIKNNDFIKIFKQRIQKTPQEFTAILDQDKNDNNNNNNNIRALSLNECLFDNTFYLSKIDEKKRRFYEKYEKKTNDMLLPLLPLLPIQIALNNNYCDVFTYPSVNSDTFDLTKSICTIYNTTTPTNVRAPNQIFYALK